MSSRILSPAEAERIKPIDWRRVSAAPDATHPASVQATHYAADPQQFDQVESRWLAKLQEAEAAWKNKAEQEYQRGLRDGEATGIRKAAGKIDPIMDRMTRSIAELAGYRDRFRREAEHDLIGLALAIARRVLQRELMVDPEAILGLVKVAMEKLSLREVHCVRVHGEDVAAVRNHLERIGAPAAIKVEADPGLERGGLIFETARGDLDASLNTQLQQIEAGFTDIARRSS